MLHLFKLGYDELYFSSFLGHTWSKELISGRARVDQTELRKSQTMRGVFQAELRISRRYVVLPDKHVVNQAELRISLRII